MVNEPTHIFATTTTALKMPEKPEMEKTDALKDNPTEKPLSKAGPQPLDEKPERGATRGGVKFIALAMLLVVPCAYFCASQHAATISTDNKFLGATTVGTQVIFAPWTADCMGALAIECQYAVRLLLLPC